MTFCRQPDPQAFSALDTHQTRWSDGFTTTGGGKISVNGFEGERFKQVRVIGAKLPHTLENWHYFWKNSGLLKTTPDFNFGDETNATKPTDNGIYYQQGNLEITHKNPWSVSSGESITVFVDGNLFIRDNTNRGRIISVEPGGFLAFIIKENLFVRNNVGNTKAADRTPNIEGVFVAQQDIIIATRGDGIKDKRFVGAGVFASWGSVKLQRDYKTSDTITNFNTLNNACHATDVFIHRPDLLTTTPKWMRRPTIIWQETN